MKPMHGQLSASIATARPDKLETRPGKSLNTPTSHIQPFCCKTPPPSYNLQIQHNTTHRVPSCAPPPRQRKPTSPTPKFQLSNVYATAPCPSSSTMHPKASLIFPPSPFCSRPTSFSSQCKAQRTLPSGHCYSMTQDSIQPTFSQPWPKSSQYANIQPTFSQH